MAAACGEKGSGPATATGSGSGSGSVSAPGSGSAPASGAKPLPPPPAGDPLLAIDDRAALAALEAAGGDLGTMLGDGYEPIRELVRTNVERAMAIDPDAGIGIKGNPHRLFDPAWLDAPAGRFELVGVVYRVDLVDTAACGDVRLIYRLGYRITDPEPLASRVPMTIALVLPLPGATPYTPADGGDLAAITARCRDTVAAWFPGASPPTGAALARWLLDHSLRDLLAPARVKLALLNYQLERWPSAVSPSLGTFAQYDLAIATRGADGWALTPLPMNPDVEGIAGDPVRRAALLAWVRDPATIAAADRGVVTLPPELAETLAIGVAPGGFARRANRSFSRLVTPAQLADLDLGDRDVVRTPAAYLRRLDEMTCHGCHQQRALAGFHWLGVDPPDVTPGDGLAVHQSPHLIRELARRARIARALVGAPDPLGAPTLARPLADAPSHVPGGLGDHCGLGGDPAFAAWTCADGLTCERGETPIGDDTVGVCMSPEPVVVGDACDLGPIVPGRIASRDRIAEPVKRRCKSGVCDPRKLGLPGGECVSSCIDGSKPRGPDQTCGRIGATGFNLCLLSSTFPTCLRDQTRPVSVRACDRDLPCRDDYLCGGSVGGGAGGGPTRGACVPPYFLFQLRVDGHPRIAPPK